jgi:hypothetical protein
VQLRGHRPPDRRIADVFDGSSIDADIVFIAFQADENSSSCCSSRRQTDQGCTTPRTRRGINQKAFF